MYISTSRFPPTPSPLLPRLPFSFPLTHFCYQPISIWIWNSWPSPHLFRLQTGKLNPSIRLSQDRSFQTSGNSILKTKPFDQLPEGWPKRKCHSIIIATGFKETLGWGHRYGCSVQMNRIRKGQWGANGNTCERRLFWEGNRDLDLIKLTPRSGGGAVHLHLRESVWGQPPAPQPCHCQALRWQEPSGKNNLCSRPGHLLRIEGWRSFFRRLSAMWDPEPLFLKNGMYEIKPECISVRSRYSALLSPLTALVN